MHDCGWKNIIVEYGGVNQWKVNNSKTRIIYIMSSICFDESFNYYDISYEITNEYGESAKLDNIWNEAGDNKFSKVIARK